MKTTLLQNQRHSLVTHPFPLDPHGEYVPQRLYLRLNPKHTYMGLENRFENQECRLLCVCSKNHGSNEETSTYQHVSIPVPPMITLTLPHEKSAFKLISPGHQSLGSILQLCNRGPQALRVTNSHCVTDSFGSAEPRSPGCFTAC